MFLSCFGKKKYCSRMAGEKEETDAHGGSLSCQLRPSRAESIQK
jgi:hypothetical protein